MEKTVDTLQHAVVDLGLKSLQDALPMTLYGVSSIFGCPFACSPREPQKEGAAPVKVTSSPLKKGAANKKSCYLEYYIGDRCDNFRPETDKMGETFSGNLLIQEVKGFSGV